MAGIAFWGCCRPRRAPFLTCSGRLSPAEQLPPRRVQEERAVLVIHRGQVLGEGVGACGRHGGCWLQAGEGFGEVGEDKAGLWWLSPSGTSRNRR